jgi:hypothetical protein
MVMHDVASMYRTAEIGRTAPRDHVRYSVRSLRRTSASTSIEPAGFGM